LGGANEVAITSITTWSVASILGDPLGAEFTNVSLYFRPQGGTWHIATDAQGRPETGTPNPFFDAGDHVNSYNNPDITSTEVPYNRRVLVYQSTNPATPDVYFPLWQNTFSNMYLQLLTGVKYEFAVWGTNPNPDPTTLYGYWFNHYSNPFLSGAREDNLSGTYLRCDATNLSAPCFVEDPRIDQTWNKGANLNIEIDGNVVPEPSSLLLTGGAMIGVALFLRKRQRAFTERGN